MIELEIANSQNAHKTVKLCLPEEPGVLWRRLQAIGIEESNYEIINVRCYPGGLEPLITRHTELALLNRLALRLKQLPVFRLNQIEAFLEHQDSVSFASLFCLLDQWEKPGHLEQLEIYFPAALQMIHLEPGDKAAIWQKRGISTEEAVDYFACWNEQMERQKPAEEGERGLAYYLHDTALCQQVFSIEPTLSIVADALYLKLTCAVKRTFTRDETERLQKACLELCQTRWGLADCPQLSGKRLQLSVSGSGAKLLHARQEQTEKKPPLFAKEPVLIVNLYPKAPNYAEQDILLSLPASRWSLQDALRRLGVRDELEMNLNFVDCPRLPVFSDWLWSQTEQGGVLGTLSEWNTLAHLLDSMDSFADNRLEALAEAIEETTAESLEAVLQLVGWAIEGVLLETIFEDDALGQFCLENGYLKDQAWLFAQMEPYVDYSQIGKQWREANGGIYTERGYLIGTPHPVMQDPDVPIPEEDGVVQICFEAADGTSESVFFPVGIACDTKERWQRNLAMAKHVSVDCIAPSLIPAIYEDIENLELLQELSERLAALQAAEQLVFFQALLEARNHPDLEGALEASYQLEAYRYFGDCQNAHCFGQKLFELQCNVKLTEEEQQTIQFGRYGELMAARLGAVETSYGYLLPKGAWIEA